MNQPDQITIPDDAHLLMHVVNRHTKEATIRVLINGHVHPRLVGFKTVRAAAQACFSVFPMAKVCFDGRSWLQADDSGVTQFRDAVYYRPQLEVPLEFIPLIDEATLAVIVEGKKARFAEYLREHPHGDSDLVLRIESVIHDLSFLPEIEKMGISRHLEVAVSQLEFLQGPLPGQVVLKTDCEDRTPHFEAPKVLQTKIPLVPDLPVQEAEGTAFGGGEISDSRSPSQIVFDEHVARWYADHGLTPQAFEKSVMRFLKWQQSSEDKPIVQLDKALFKVEVEFEQLFPDPAHPGYDGPTITHAKDHFGPSHPKGE